VKTHRSKAGTKRIVKPTTGDLGRHNAEKKDGRMGKRGETSGDKTSGGGELLMGKPKTQGNKRLATEGRGLGDSKRKKGGTGKAVKINKANNPGGIMCSGEILGGNKPSGKPDGGEGWEADQKKLRSDRKKQRKSNYMNSKKRETGI